MGVALPPTVGHVAVNARYLHHEEVDDGTIAAAVTMSQIVNVVTTVLLLIVLGVLTGSGFSRFKIAPGADVLIGLLVILAIVIVLLAVPQTRAKLTGTVWPHLQAVWPRLLDAISHPVRLAISSAANVLLSVAYLVAMLAALWSVGAHPPILATAVVLPGRQRGGSGGADARRNRRSGGRPGRRADSHRHPGTPGDSRGAHLPHGDVLAAHPGRLDLLPGAAAARHPVAMSSPGTSV